MGGKLNPYHVSKQMRADESIFNTICPRKGLMASLLELPPREGAGATQVCFPGSGTRNTWLLQTCMSGSHPWVFLMHYVQGEAQEIASSQVMLLLLIWGASFEKHTGLVPSEAIAREEWMTGLAELIYWLWLWSIHGHLWISATAGRKISHVPNVWNMYMYSF